MWKPGYKHVQCEEREEKKESAWKGFIHFKHVETEEANSEVLKERNFEEREVEMNVAFMFKRSRKRHIFSYFFPHFLNYQINLSLCFI